MSRDIVTRNIVHGELGAFGTRPGVVIGERLRQALNLRTGDKITLVTHRLNENGTIAPRYSDYDVLASFLTRRYEFDNAPGLRAAADAAGRPRIRQRGGELDRPRHRRSRRRRRSSPRSCASRWAATTSRSRDWLGLNARFVGALQVERVMMFIILTLIVVVAAMNVVASFTMLVRVKRGSIAILRTMGAAPGTIVRAFFMSAAAVGLVGTAVGTGLGLLVCANMHGDRPAAVAADQRRRPGGRLERGRVHHLGAGARAGGRGAVRHRHRPRAVAGGGGLSGLAQHARRTGRRAAS